MVIFCMEISVSEFITLCIVGNLEEVNSRTRLQKFAFLIQEEAIDAEPYDFKKYDYGAFSDILMEDLEKLEDRGLVDITSSRTFGGNTRNTYEITSKGETVLKAHYPDSNIEEVKNDIENFVGRHSDKSTRELIEYEKENHPQFITNTVYQT